MHKVLWLGALFAVASCQFDSPFFSGSANKEQRNGFNSEFFKSAEVKLPASQGESEGQRTGFGSSFGSSFSDRTFFRGGQGEDEQEDDTTVTPPPEIDPEAGLAGLSKDFRKLSKVTQAVVDEARRAIRQLIDDNREENGDLPFNGGLLRLSFHDCVGESGCDGCINHFNEANDGLLRYTEPLDILYRDNFFHKMTRADFYALSGIVAVEYSSELADCDGPGCTPQIEFKYGRGDCLNPQEITHKFCPFHGNAEEFMRDEFGMDREEYVAIVGAHTLGRVNKKGAGAFDDTPEKFDNDYYKQLLDESAGWRISRRPQKKLEESWVRADGTNIMLGSDFFLVSNLEFADESCDPGPLNCPRMSSRDFVEDFAADNKRFLAKFAVAMQKVIDKSDTPLHTVE